MLRKEPPALEELDLEGTSNLGFHHLVEGRNARALECFERRFQNEKDPYYALQVALVAHALKNTDRRDAAFKAVARDGPGSTRQHLAELAALLEAALAQGGDLDTAAVQKVIDSEASDVKRATLECFVGQYFDVVGARSKGRPFYEHALAHAGAWSASRLLSRIALSKKD